jgi:hypothetical protein
MTRRWRWSGALVTAALASCLMAAPAGADITYSGIGDVKLGMSGAEVRETLGEPSSSGPAPDPRGTVLKYPRRKLEVVVFEDRVRSIFTTSRAHRTASGVGVGVTERDMRAKLRGEKCNRLQGRTVCSINRRNRVISFMARRGRVIESSVGG